ncbi:CHRD domain-containing protein [Acidisoma sp. C75]
MTPSRLSTGRRRLLAVAAGLGLALTGALTVTAAHADPVTLTAKLVPVPGAPPTGLGHMVAQYDPTTQLLTWRVTYSGLSGPVVAAHIHGPATPTMDQAPLASAPVVVPFTPPLTSPIQGSAKLTLDQVSQLLGGLYYVNLHTAAFPGGEIRGQINVQPTN